MAEFPILANSGYAVTEAGYEDCPVLGFFGDDLRDRAVLYGMHRVLTKAFGLKAVEALPEVDGSGTVLVANLSSDALFEMVRDLRLEVAREVYVCETDYFHVLREAVEQHWDGLDIAGRIACCRAASSSLAFALEDDVPDVLQPHIEHVLEQW